MKRRAFFRQALSGAAALAVPGAVAAEPTADPDAFTENGVHYRWIGWNPVGHSDVQSGVWTAHDGVRGRMCYATTAGTVRPYFRGYQFDISGPANPVCVADSEEYHAERRARALANLRRVMADTDVEHHDLQYGPHSYWKD